MPYEQLQRMSELLRERNRIDAQIAALMHRPMTSGHLGEWIASHVFNIELEGSATTPAVDGRFRGGPLAGRTVNIKWYPKREGLLDMTTSEALDCYLVMTGPVSSAASSIGAVRPWCIQNVYLFDAPRLLAEQRRRGVKVGTASSVPQRLWAAAEIHPAATSDLITLPAHQAELLNNFAPIEG